MVGRSRWDKLGRPGAALVGAAYHGWESQRYPTRPYVVVGAKHARQREPAKAKKK